MVDRGQQLRRITPRAALGGGYQHFARTAQHTLAARDRVQRRLAADGAVTGGAEPVDVGPRPLALAVGVVLLERRVARRHQDRHRARLAHARARRAEVEQHRTAVLADQDVLGLDVAVDETRRVHQRQPVDDRQHDVVQLALGQGLAPFQQCRQGFTLFVLHHHVGGVVVLELRVHAHDVGVAEARQRARLADEALQPGSVALALCAATRADRGVGAARGGVHRQVFLDRHQLVEVAVARQVGDAEAALAQHALQHVPVQHVLRGESIRKGRIGHRCFHAAHCVMRSWECAES